ncbi:hypothetical protein [Brevibacterium paucivorans]|uniref:hypothetical protein n=1 Tax=Brevibacterium paucivorans TaxID=170994 RepID=UPI0025ED93A1|nr:hypothetical protein [uncultured Brevibacterium sp.]
MLISTARVLDDDIFKWRVMGACIQHASQLDTIKGGEAKSYALRVLANPHTVEPMMLSLVASNPAIANAVKVDEVGTVDTTGVSDQDIQYVVAESWGTVAMHVVGSVNEVTD